MSILYDTLQKWFLILPPLTSPLTFFIDAPFGRFTSRNTDSIFVIDGIKSWILMELVSPAAFAYTFLHAPLQQSQPSNIVGSFSGPQLLLAALFLVHYANRSLISPLRTPSRSKSHAMVAGSAIAFNAANGFLMGAYLSSPLAQNFLADAFGKPAFWAGNAIWAAGLAGNIIHDEILFNIRRKAKAKGKGRSEDGSKGEHYAIPHGFLYALISYPNYLCEWLEWAGFAIAAAPAPPLALVATMMATPSVHAFTSLARVVHPPWIFFLAEVLLMLPRAYRGHKWYHERFPEYPKERKAVIPFLF